MIGLTGACAGTDLRCGTRSSGLAGGGWSGVGSDGCLSAVISYISLVRFSAFDFPLSALVSELSSHKNENREPVVSRDQVITFRGLTAARNRPRLCLSGLSSLDSELWTLDSRLWTLDSQKREPRTGRPKGSSDYLSGPYGCPQPAAVLSL